MAYLLREDVNQKNLDAREVVVRRRAINATLTMTAETIVTKLIVVRFEIFSTTNCVVIPIE